MQSGDTSPDCYQPDQFALLRQQQEESELTCWALRRRIEGSAFVIAPATGPGRRIRLPKTFSLSAERLLARVAEKDDRPAFRSSNGCSIPRADSLG
jgi:hypothetical protein